jgi:hypothetical protein
MFGELPAYGFFIRHVKGLQLRDVEMNYLKEDFRPAFWLNDVNGIEFLHVKAQHASAVPIFDLRNVTDFLTHECWPLADTRLEKVESRKL